MSVEVTATPPMKIEIAGLTAEEQEAFAAAMAAGEPPKAIIARYFPPRRGGVSKDKRSRKVAGIDAILRELAAATTALSKAAAGVDRLSSAQEQNLKTIVATLQRVSDGRHS